MFLYQTAVKGIQSWIIGSGRLREIAGGSEIVDRLAELSRSQAMRLGLDASKIQAAAGRATIRFERRDQLEAFAQWWPMAVATRAPGLSVVQAWTEGEDWGSLQRRMAEAGCRVPQDLPEAGPLMARSGRSGLPAVRREHDGSVDRGAKARFDAYNGGRDRLASQLLPDERDRSFVKEVEDFPPGYLAVVHADANGVGRRFRDGKVSDPQAFSDALSQATENAARSALSEILRSGDRVLARPIVLGGDDFSILVPAQQSLAFARKFLHTFEAETESRSAALGSKISACAGVAIVKPGWPFSAAHALAEDLCKSAKRAFRLNNESGLAFRRVTTALIEDGDELMAAQDPEAKPGLERRVLSCNPYRLDRLDLLAAFSKAAELMPRGALRRWVDLAQIDLARAQEHWDRVREVVNARDPASLRQFDDALTALDCFPESGWQRDYRCTPVPDALEWRRVSSRAQSAGGH